MALKAQTVVRFDLETTAADARLEPWQDRCHTVSIRFGSYQVWSAQQATY
jgi:hypothetical protein